MNLQLGWGLEHDMLMIIPVGRIIAHALDGAAGCPRAAGGGLDHGCRMPVAVAFACRHGW